MPTGSEKCAIRANACARRRVTFPIFHPARRRRGSQVLTRRDCCRAATNGDQHYSGNRTHALPHQRVYICMSIINERPQRGDGWKSFFKCDQIRPRRRAAMLIDWCAVIHAVAVRRMSSLLRPMGWVAAGGGGRPNGRRKKNAGGCGGCCGWVVWSQ